jgi:hypothetical protein
MAWVVVHNQPTNLAIQLHNQPTNLAFINKFNLTTNQALKQPT